MPVSELYYSDGEILHQFTADMVGALSSSTKYAGSSSVGGDATRAEKVKDSYNGNNLTFTYYKSGQSSTSWLGSWNGSELGAISPANITAGKATTLATTRSIALGTGVTSTATNFNGSANITIPVTGIKEAYLEWGGKNYAGSFGPIDAAMVPNLGANRFAFIKPDGVEIQASTDGGSTWSAVTVTDGNKINFFNDNTYGLYIGNNSSNGIDKSKYQLRVIITTNTASVYTILNKFVIYVSTNGSTGSWCTIDAKRQTDVANNNDTWVTFANEVSLSGWSGYNVINTSSITTYGNNSAQYQKLRFTFGVTSHVSSVTSPGLQIWSIMGFGGVGWSTPSTMAKTGRIYTYDSAQNTKFPAQVTATQFNGALNGKATSATTADSATSAAKLDTSTAGSATQPCYFTNGKPSACTYTLGKSVPSNAVFTNTKQIAVQSTQPTDSNVLLWIKI